MGEDGARGKDGLGHGGITCVLQTQFSSLSITYYFSTIMSDQYITGLLFGGRQPDLCCIGVIKYSVQKKTANHLHYPALKKAHIIYVTFCSFP